MRALVFLLAFVAAGAAFADALATPPIPPVQEWAGLAGATQTITVTAVTTSGVPPTVVTQSIVVYNDDATNAIGVRVGTVSSITAVYPSNMSNAGVATGTSTATTTFVVKPGQSFAFDQRCSHVAIVAPAGAPPFKIIAIY